MASGEGDSDSFPTEGDYSSIVTELPFYGSTESLNNNISYDCLGSYEICATISKWTAPIIAIFGLLGNLFIFLVMLKKRNRKISCCVYMAVLSVCDSLSLAVYTGLAIYSYYDSILVHPSTSGCKSAIYLLNMSSSCGHLLLIALTVDRYLAVCYPLKSRVYCTPRRARIISLLLTIVSIIYNIPHAVFASLHNLDGRKVCLTLITGDNHAVIYGVINIILFVLIPFLILLVLNLKIIKVIRKRKQPVPDRNGKSTPSSKSTDSSNSSKPRSRAFSFRVHIGGGRKDSSGHLHGDAHKKSEKETQLTIMLLFVTFAFVILAAPQYIRLLISLYSKQKIDVLHSILAVVFMRLYSINFAINFYLYYMSGSKFRLDVWRILCCVVMERSPEGTDSQFANIQMHASCSDLRNMSRQVSHITTEDPRDSPLNKRIQYMRQFSLEAPSTPPTTFRKLKTSFEDYRRRKTSLCPPVYLAHAHSASNVPQLLKQGARYQDGVSTISRYRTQARTTLQVPGMEVRSSSCTHIYANIIDGHKNEIASGDGGSQVNVNTQSKSPKEKKKHAEHVTSVCETREEISFKALPVPQIHIHFEEEGENDAKDEKVGEQLGVTKISSSSKFAFSSVRVASSRIIDTEQFFKERQHSRELPYLEESKEPSSSHSGDDMDDLDVTLGPVPNSREASGRAPNSVPIDKTSWARLSVGDLLESQNAPQHFTAGFQGMVRRVVSENNLCLEKL